MMSLINEAMLAVSSSVAASIVAKATVTTALGLTGVWLARKSRAAVRHALLAATFGVLLALPIASILEPPFRIAAPPVEQRKISTVAGAGSAIPSGAPARVRLREASAVPPSAGVPFGVVLLAGWIAGMALFLTPVAMGLWQVRALRRVALPWRHGQAVADRLAIETGIHRRVEVLLHGAAQGPMTCGVLHPAIVMPQDAESWEVEDLDRAMVHELEHVRRGDWVSHCLARAVCGVYWFHPLVWIAWRQLAVEAERACDDAVLRHSEATTYADQLVGLARRLSLAAKSPMLAMANRADLKTRVDAVLDSRQQRGRAGMLPVALACTAAAVLVLTVAPLTMVAAAQSATPDANAKPMTRFSAQAGLVIEAVKVTDQNGKTVEGLSANDFVVMEDGAQQTIHIFEFQKLAAQPQGSADSLSSYYLLGFYPTNQNVDGNFRRIKINSTRDAVAKLDYRPGHYADKSFGLPGGAGNVTADQTLPPGVTYPELLRKVEPEYSEGARKAKFQGHVSLNVEIDPAGLVSNIQVIRSLGMGLDEKAIEAVRQWKFKPAMKDGKPFTVQVEVGVDFRLL